jgi:hypothetical protein
MTDPLRRLITEEPMDTDAPEEVSQVETSVGGSDGGTTRSEHAPGRTASPLLFGPKERGRGSKNPVVPQEGIHPTPTKN